MPESTKEDKDLQLIIDSRASVSEEIFFSLMRSVKDRYRELFPPSSTYNVWHDGDKRSITEIAKLLFTRTVTYDDVTEMADQVWTPKIESAGAAPDEHAGTESTIQEKVGDF